MRRVNNMEVIKRDGSKVAFDGSKIENAILKAMRYGSGIVKPEIASKISHEIEDWHKSSGAASISIYRIEGIQLIMRFMVLSIRLIKKQWMKTLIKMRQSLRLRET